MKSQECVLLMFSGGRDSFLSACRLIENGYKIYMITYDNGCVSNIRCVEDTANRISKRYGYSKSEFIGIKNIFHSFYRFREPCIYREISEISKTYPRLKLSQLDCLCCQTGMYADAIAFCKVHGIKYIANGSRKTQKFFVELPEMIKRYKRLGRQNDIEIIYPVYNLEDDYVRKLEISGRGYVPKVLEPQCWLGCPLRNELSRKEINCLNKYFKNEISPQLREIISSKEKQYVCESRSFRMWEGIK